MAKPKRPKKSTPIKKSRSNNSGRPSAAKRTADSRAKAAKKTKIKRSKKPVTQKKSQEAKNARLKKAPSAPLYNHKLSALKEQTPKQLPETELSKKGMSLRSLLRGTPKLMLNNSQDVVIDSITKTKTKSGMPAVKAVTYTSDPFRPAKTRRPHNTFIIGLDKDKEGNNDLKTPINKHKKVLVSCACENYVLGGAEYANAVHGASRIVYGNGAPPLMTNPALAPFLCKHLVEVARVLIKRNQ